MEQNNIYGRDIHFKGGRDKVVNLYTPLGEYLNFEGILNLIDGPEDTASISINGVEVDTLSGIPGGTQGALQYRSGGIQVGSDNIYGASADNLHFEADDFILEGKISSMFKTQDETTSKPLTLTTGDGNGVSAPFASGDVNIISAYNASNPGDIAIYAGSSSGDSSEVIIKGGDSYGNANPADVNFIGNNSSVEFVGGNSSGGITYRGRILLGNADIEDLINVHSTLQRNGHNMSASIIKTIPSSISPFTTAVLQFTTIMKDDDPTGIFATYHSTYGQQVTEAGMYVCSISAHCTGFSTGNTADFKAERRNSSGTIITHEHNTQLFSDPDGTRSGVYHGTYTDVIYLNADDYLTISLTYSTSAGLSAARMTMVKLPQYLN